MRVALDATPLTLSSGGLRRYTLELALALAREFPDDEFHLMSDQPFVRPLVDLPNLKSGAGPHDWLGRRWWMCGLPRELSRRGIEVFHGTDFAVPYLPLRPSVLTLHDLSPWMNPSWHAAADRVRRRTPLLLGLRIATMVVTVSDAVRAQAIDRFGIHPSRIVTVTNAAAAMFRPVAVEPAAVPYFLFVGTLEPRKNIPGLLEAWRVVRRSNRVDLVLAGRRRSDFRELPAEDGMRYLGEVADEDLPGLYSGAAAVVYPSWYEGFGLPVLEAMQSGACVITSADPAVREVTGGAAFEVPTGDIARLAEAMAAVLTNPERARDERRRGLLRARLFSWQRSARLTRQVYEEAQRRFG